MKNLINSYKNSLIFNSDEQSFLSTFLKLDETSEPNQKDLISRAFKLWAIPNVIKFFDTDKYNELIYLYIFEYDKTFLQNYQILINEIVAQ